MTTMIQLPRTWFARTRSDETLFVRRFDPANEEPFFEIYGYTSDLASAPSPLSIPEAIPERIGSLEEAFGYAARCWGLAAGAFAEATSGRLVSIDLIEALKTLNMAPLRPGMAPAEARTLLGMPEAANCTVTDGVCWFYGAVQLHFEQGALVRLEVDRGADDFTSLRFEHWFIAPVSTMDQVSAALAARAISFRRVVRYGRPMLDVGASAGRPQFVFDFDPETSRVHAMYWDPLATLDVPQLEEDQG
jgi:hypothetical protein